MRPGKLRIGTAELEEFDIDAAVARKPQLILVDELAHTNAPGSRHPKRWQDVDELLAQGIDVFTTLNVQHLESLNDVVGGITGIKVWETVPDTFFDRADDVVLVDIPAEELLARLKDGKVYLPEQAQRAATNFFRKGNLMALRELALRRTAETRLAESEIGNPIRIFDDQKLISSDVAHSVREQAEILRHSGLGGFKGTTIAELGAGHGRLAELFGRTTNFRYFIFDITPALYVSEWYVTHLFPNEKIFKFRPFASFDEIAAELSQCRFAFFTANQLALLPDNLVDIFININSLMEMRRDQIELFLKQMGRVASQFFFCKQWIDWTNGIDAVRVEQRDYDLGEGWRRISDAQDEIYQQFFTSLWRKAV